MGRLNISAAILGSACPLGVKCTYNKVRFMSLFTSMNFFLVELVDFIFLSTCPLLWWCYDDIGCSIFNSL